MTWPQPVELQGSRVTLVPLTQGHKDDLVEALHDGELWKLWYTSISSPDRLVDFIDKRLVAQAQGDLLPFAVLDNTTGKAVGTTNYLNVEVDHRRIEIGGTWYRKSVQRSEVNTQCNFYFSSMHLKHCIVSPLSFGPIFQLPESSWHRASGRKTGRYIA